VIEQIPLLYQPVSNIELKREKNMRPVL